MFFRHWVNTFWCDECRVVLHVSWSEGSTVDLLREISPSLWAAIAVRDWHLLTSTGYAQSPGSRRDQYSSSFSSLSGTQIMFSCRSLKPPFLCVSLLIFVNQSESWIFKDVSLRSASPQSFLLSHSWRCSSCRWPLTLNRNIFILKDNSRLCPSYTRHTIFGWRWLSPSEGNCGRSRDSQDEHVPGDQGCIEVQPTTSLWPICAMALKLYSTAMMRDDTAIVFGEDVAFGGVFRCTMVSGAP